MQYLTLFGLCALLWFSCTIMCSAESHTSDIAPENATIKSWEYCEGCKETVNLFSKKFAAALHTMHTSGVRAFSQFEASSVVNLICDDKHFTQFIPSLRYSCIKIMNDHSTAFLTQFQGNASSVTIANKGEVFKRKKQVSAS